MINNDPSIDRGSARDHKRPQQKLGRVDASITTPEEAEVYTITNDLTNDLGTFHEHQRLKPRLADSTQKPTTRPL